MDNRNRNIAIGVTLLLLGLIVACAGLWNLIKQKTVHAHELKAEAIQKALERDENLILKSMLSDIQADIEDLSQRIVGNNAVPFIEMVENLGKAAGVRATIASVSVTPTFEGEKYENLVLAINAEGNWDKIYTYLKMLESLPYKVKVQSAN
jgi:hypothetical protein